MARDSAEEEKLLASKSDDEADEEEEALSLCDLPLNEGKQCSKEIEATQMRENEEEFNFGSRESEMCAADEVFFKGQILPLRLSVSSESGLAKFQQESRNPSRCLSRSESMDHGSSGGLTSINSSRSSSTRSYYSSTTTTSINSTSSKQKIRNNFHSCPSPNPQIRVSSFRLSNVSNSSSRTQKSTIWDLFRIGLVRAPEIELQDLKLRNSVNNGGNRSASVSRNSSSGSSSNNSSSNIKNYSGNTNGSQKDPNLEKKQTKKQNSIFDKRIPLFNLSGCKCSINAVETVPLNNKNNNNNIVVIKSGVGSSEDSKIKKKKKKKKKNRTKKEEEKQVGKQAISRHRTFEWLKELSHGSYVVVDGDDVHQNVQHHHHHHGHDVQI